MVAKRKIAQRATKSQKGQKTLFFLHSTLLALERICPSLSNLGARARRIRRKTKIEIIILKIMVFPQAAGWNQGVTASKGKAKIKKNPIR